MSQVKSYLLNRLPMCCSFIDKTMSYYLNAANLNLIRASRSKQPRTCTDAMRLTSNYLPSYSRMEDGGQEQFCLTSSTSWQSVAYCPESWKSECSIVTFLEVFSTTNSHDGDAPGVFRTIGMTLPPQRIRHKKSLPGFLVVVQIYQYRL